ncbi:ATP-dependent sacrificial sulfur transferase LarE [Anaerocolumna sp. MB42-C2]|uniref:ATP-dependent sacrificial sulfur transferase LarE n=1 Tax=Anaerocolumna sp. MB42-C2 TaxID=3070997 RepID=UPI0027E1B54A|nr:ATP-dependent sacrificial sulfur transferase LarE [Anaerocolumna sp. MB42-C2]WMJ88958.1 ATP-dependent sacrificial sulfur transferase LarE [Anaerocolumna sp. MB42-C2]
MDLHVKYDLLKENLRNLESVAVAFSGGVDSTFLLKTAFDVLGEHVLAVTARSSTYPEREFREAKEFTDKYKIPHEIIVSEELEVEGFSDNPVNRCYLCKNELFEKIGDIAYKHGILHVAEGSNHDDLSDYRPGLKAISEHGVISPLRMAELTKDEIRILSKELGLPTWNKQSFACLSSRFPYGQKITKEKLEMVDKAEQLLLDEGFRQVRVRHHGDIARIEVSQNEIQRFFDLNFINHISETFKKIGFSYTTLDLKGYRTGSMNETL